MTNSQAIVHRSNLLMAICELLTRKLADDSPELYRNLFKAIKRMYEYTSIEWEKERLRTNASHGIMELNHHPRMPEICSAASALVQLKES